MPRFSIVASDDIIIGDNDGHRRLHQFSRGGFSSAAAVANGGATIEGAQEVVVDEITSSSVHRDGSSELLNGEDQQQPSSGDVEHQEQRSAEVGQAMAADQSLQTTLPATAAQESPQQQIIETHQPLTKVNGKGLWKSWKRNFNSKLLALMDLIDNSLDAAIVVTEKRDCDNAAAADDSDNNDEFVGRVHVSPDRQTTDNIQSVRAMGSDFHNSALPEESISNVMSTTTTTGIIITNNSYKPIRPLQNILEVYNSSKTHSGSVHIGENGVGLKQGAATCSDLTFCLVKRRLSEGDGEGEGVIELGLIAESLQREEGCCLPAFTFPISNDGGKSDITNLLSDPLQHEIADCVMHYGGNSLERGIDRLSKHFHNICFGETFGSDDNVFTLILDRVDYGHNETTESKCHELLKDLRKSLSRFYLHVPSSFDFRIGRGQVPFDYWQKRLVEFSSASLLMNHSSYWHEYKPESDPGSYKLRVLAGFDRMRINDKSQGREGSLYFYSRESGRLIKSDKDGRGYLNLANTGSMFCQGLTIIIDDIGGQFPLNPTKQAIAFAEQTTGAIHEENLIALVGAFVKTYYEHHLNKYGNRTTLTTAVKEFGVHDIELDHQIKDIDSSELTTFEYTSRAVAQAVGKKVVRIDKYSLEVKNGRDTHMKLLPPRQGGVEVIHRNSGQKRRAEAEAVVDVALEETTVERQDVIVARLSAGGRNGHDNNAAQRAAFAQTAERAIQPTTQAAINVPQQQQQHHNLNTLRENPPQIGTTRTGKSIDHLNTLRQNSLRQHEQQQQQQQSAAASQASERYYENRCRELEAIISNQQRTKNEIISGAEAFKQEIIANKRKNNAVIQELQMANQTLKTQLRISKETIGTHNQMMSNQTRKNEASLQNIIANDHKKDTIIEELEMENQGLKDDITRKDARVREVEAQMEKLKQQFIALVQNKAESMTSETI